MDYWKNKEQNALKARKHTKEMKENFSSRISQCVKDTIIYNEDFKHNKVSPKTQKIVIVNTDSVSAIFNYSIGKTAVLNFASYKNPGGQFINGSIAQEECLCHSSFLYNVLSEFTIDYYDWNNHNKNKALYYNRALFTPDVLFMSGNSICFCDVITCAAPNKKAAQKYCNVSNHDNRKALSSRIEFVLEIAKKEGIESLILGAYGCGVFGQDPYEVASIFKEMLTAMPSFKNVIFAIPDNTSTNYKAFSKVFRERS